MFSFGNNLFIGHMPDTPDECICIYILTSDEPEQLTRIEYPNAEIRCRSTTQSAALVLANAAYKYLHESVNYTPIASTVYATWALTSPELVGTDEKNRVVYSVKFKSMRNIFE